MYVFQKPQRLINKVFIHCSDSQSPRYDIPAMRKDHINRGWVDIAYHLIIDRNGNIVPGRSLDLAPASQGKGRNQGTLAICLMGDGKFLPVQFSSLRDLCRSISDAYQQNITFHGHCEVKDTDCPKFDYRKILELDSRGYLLKPLRKSRTIISGLVLSMASVFQEVFHYMQAASLKIQTYQSGLSYVFQSSRIIIWLVLITAIGMILYARLDDRKKRKR